MEPKKVQKQGRDERTQEDYPTSGVYFCRCRVVFLRSFISALFLYFFRLHPYLKSSFTETFFPSTKIAFSCLYIGKISCKTWKGIASIIKCIMLVPNYVYLHLVSVSSCPEFALISTNDMYGLYNYVLVNDSDVVITVHPRAQAKVLPYRPAMRNSIFNSDFFSFAFRQNNLSKCA